MGRFRPLRSNGGVMPPWMTALVACSPGSTPPASPTFSDVLPAAVADPAPPRGPAKKRKRETMPPEYVKGPGKKGELHPHWRKSFPDDEEDADGRGKVEQGLPGHGVWRRVPGFWMILASEDGNIMTIGGSKVRTPTVGNNRYLRVGCNGTPERVHLLVARAFHGRPLPDQVSVDHKDHNESNNCKTNLQWATAAEQIHNQGKRKANSHGEPCLVWQVEGERLKMWGKSYDTTPVAGTEKKFKSLSEAATTLSLSRGILSNVLNGKCKTVTNPEGKHYTGKWNPDLSDVAEDEQWKEYWTSNTKALNISSYGRIQWVYNGREGTKHYPECSNDMTYFHVKVNGKNKTLHILVGELFFIGPKPYNWVVWDHKDRDPQNNHISNLRPVTLEENCVNTARQRDFFLWPVGEPDDWVRCVSQNATARVYGIDNRRLNNVLHKRKQQNGSVRRTVGGYCAAFCDEVDTE